MSKKRSDSGGSKRARGASRGKNTGTGGARRDIRATTPAASTQGKSPQAQAGTQPKVQAPAEGAETRRLHSNIDFIGRTRWWFLLSASIIVIGVVAMLVRGFNFSIEFVGGSSFDLKPGRAISVVRARALLADFGLEKSIVQPVGANELLIRTRHLSQTEQKEVRDSLGTAFGVKAEEINVVAVGPGWGQHLTDRALLALGLALGALLVYISVRFEFKMAVAAVAALVHDLLVTAGIYALVGREVNPNTVAALLTILGYSLYDTIIVFHRIKENSTKIVKETYAQMTNRSINQVLMRSINTSLTTLLPITAILLLGGVTLKDFAFALFIGIISGAYSSIFVASPLLVLWKEAEPYYRSLRVRYGSSPA